LKKRALSPDQVDQLQARIRDPEKSNLDWKDIARNDPVAAFSDATLKAVAAQVPSDMALVLPDFSLFAIMQAGDGNGTVDSVLSGYGMAVDWEVVDGALIGRMPVCERLMPAQVKRSVLAKLLGSMGAQGVATTNMLAQYIANQRPAASDSWCDAMMLVLAGKTLDQEFIGDYPHNIRLYTALSEPDWQLIRSGEAFPASRLTPRVQTALGSLLLQSRSRMNSEKPDPATWPTLDPNKVVIRAELIDEQVLIGFTGYGASVDKVESAALSYDMRKSELRREPLYQPAMRRKLKLSIFCVTNWANVETGFSEVVPDPKFKPVPWKDLPEEMAKKFRERALRSDG
jgi:hypothetical protein